MAALKSSSGKEKLSKKLEIAEDGKEENDEEEGSKAIESFLRTVTPSLNLKRHKGQADQYSPSSLDNCFSV
ncbi:unnamed protein product [Arabidopsis lyrata]|uniref:Predicted protein n=1 Tax=Arabidopsis lyrata subsp. lyrata TaxID=81972 RepID=D7L6E0_ARALL|nr:predicted protein [Arabidopsis lyrata subsp. lyrata]EFH62268.1 predicted protein [Arabidopsis lyrata subsp. lyrata]CAH8262807.1 unnamed protein product [Arabidopsis lyrata]CAH8266674.1 unnamed protein product [Arabidopsis lyrata]